MSVNPWVRNGRFINDNGVLKVVSEADSLETRPASRMSASPSTRDYLNLVLAMLEGQLGGMKRAFEAIGTSDMLDNAIASHDPANPISDICAHLLRVRVAIENAIARIRNEINLLPSISPSGRKGDA